MGNQPKWRCKQEWWDIDGCTISGIYSRLDVMYFEAFWKKGIKPLTILSFQQGKQWFTSGWNWLSYFQTLLDTTEDGAVLLLFGPASQRKSGASSEWGFCSLPKRGRPENDKKNDVTFLGRQGSRSWNDPYLGHWCHEHEHHEHYEHHEHHEYDRVDH